MNRIFRNERGASLVEYALVLAAVLLVLIVSFTAVGVDTNEKVENPVLVNALT